MILVTPATTAAEALTLVTSVDADVALVDVYLGEDDGIELVVSLRERAPEMAVILISTHDGDEFMESLQSTGAAGFLRKDSLGVEVISELITWH